MSDLIPEVLQSAQARTGLTATLKRFRSEGIEATPVIFGAHRKPEAVIIPFAAYEKLLNIIEDLEIAQIIKERSQEPVQVMDIKELAASIGLDPEDY